MKPSHTNQQNYFIIARSATQQDDHQRYEDPEQFGEPLCDIPLFQTKAIPSSLISKPDNLNTLEVPLHFKPPTASRPSKSPKLRNERPRLKRKHHSGRSYVSERSNSGRETTYSRYAKSEPAKSSRSDLSCTICNETDTPMWREGPEGPQTLCNVCGLIYAKRESRGKSLMLSRGYSRGTRSRDTTSDESSRKS
ncbi:gata zinc finger domain-containing 10 [Fusarium longipes]|uniref:Gata zinc finger domain-containing 10 n=1 Tax=Fusarium longipes TaxID=694270 RepID=A0A395SXK8_9HYPO|nr:gata zinc finger domain-containing 10 [Fusarium longipes]